VNFKTGFREWPTTKDRHPAGVVWLGKMTKQACRCFWEGLHSICVCALVSAPPVNSASIIPYNSSTGFMSKKDIWFYFGNIGSVGLTIQAPCFEIKKTDG